MLLFASIVIAIHERALDYNNNGFEEYSIRAVIDAADFDVSQIPYLSLFVTEQLQQSNIICSRDNGFFIEWEYFTVFVCYVNNQFIVELYVSDFLPSDFTVNHF